MPMASRAASGCSSVSRSARTSQSAPPGPMTPAYLRPLMGWTPCWMFWARAAERISNRQTARRMGLLVAAFVDWIDIGGQVFQTIDGALHGRPHDAERVQHFLRRGVIALSFDGEQIVGKVADRVFDPGEIDGERAVGVGYESAFVRQVIELQRHALAVSVGESEAQRPE